MHHPKERGFSRAIGANDNCRTNARKFQINRTNPAAPTPPQTGGFDFQGQ
jgi:hypothetical protein